LRLGYRSQAARPGYSVRGAETLLLARRRLLRPQRGFFDDQSVWLPSELRAVAQNIASRRNLPLMPRATA